MIGVIGVTLTLLFALDTQFDTGPILESHP